MSATATRPGNPHVVKVAGFMRLASEPARLEILFALRGGQLPKATLIERIDALPTTTNHHITLLRIAGLIKTERTGKTVEHALASRGRSLLSAIDGLTLD